MFNSLYLTIGRFAYTTLGDMGLNLKCVNSLLDPDGKLLFTGTGKWGVFVEMDSKNKIINIHIIIASLTLLFPRFGGMQCGSSSKTDLRRYATLVEKLVKILLVLRGGSYDSTLFGDMSSLR